VHLALPQLTIVEPGAAPVEGAVLQRWFDHAGYLVAEGGRREHGWWMHWPHLATFSFGDDGGVEAVPIVPSLEAAIEDVFRRGVIPVVLLARGFEALHAGGVLSNRGVVALCATSGTGKSTLAAALGARGLPHVADDTVLYAIEGGRPAAFPLPFEPRLDAAASAAVTRSLAWSLVSPGSRPLQSAYHLVRDDTLDPRRPRFEPVEGRGRFERLLRHALPFEMGGAERSRAFIDALLACSREVHVWDCRFAPDLAALPDLADAVARHIGDHA
jgi:hypothetical protein